MTVGVLIVDDEEDVRFLIRALIEAANEGLFVKGEAADGHEAIRRTAEVQPEVVVLDWKMPGLDGIETATLILKARPGQRFILCSAYFDPDLCRKAEAAGITVCLPKTQAVRIPSLIKAIVAAG